jgi:isoamylase
VIRIWRDHPVFKRRQFFQGRRIRGAEVKDLTWFKPSGLEMTDQAWDAHFARSLMVRLAGDSIEDVDAEGERIVDDTFLLLLNAAEGLMPFTLPAPPAGAHWHWQCILDTGVADWKRGSVVRGHRYRLQGRSLAVLQAQPRAVPAAPQPAARKESR